MRYGLIGSILIHIVVFGLVIFNFVGRKKDDAPLPAAVSVDISTPSDISQQKRGKATGKDDAPPVVAEKKEPEAQATAKKEVEQKQTPKPAQNEAMAPPQQAKSAETEPEPNKKQPEPVKQEPPKVEKAELTPQEKPKPPVKKEGEHKAAVKPKHKEQKKPEEPVKQAHEHNFDPNKIASLLKKNNDAEQPNQQSMNAQPSKNASDRQTALLNRDPNAGSPGGAYEPGKPWRPASSLEDQAKGLSSGHDMQNSATDADYLLSQISQNWDLPIGALGADTAIITLHFRLKPDGMLQGEPEIVNRSYDPAFAAAADAAKRAIFRAQPFRIPQGRYEQFRDNTISFDPRAMYGAGHG